MGNHFLIGCIQISVLRRNRKLLHVMKADGKMLKFKASIQVKDLLENFQGFAVRSSKGEPKSLPPNFELKLGKIYHLLPCKELDHTSNTETIVPSKTEATKPIIASSRIKVVITKKQLEDFLSNKASLEDILLRNDKLQALDSPSSWTPRLRSIPEETEIITI